MTVSQDSRYWEDNPLKDGELEMALGGLDFFYPPHSLRELMDSDDAFYREVWDRVHLIVRQQRQLKKFIENKREAYALEKEGLMAIPSAEDPKGLRRYVSTPSGPVEVTSIEDLIE